MSAINTDLPIDAFISMNLPILRPGAAPAQDNNDQYLCTCGEQITPMTGSKYSAVSVALALLLAKACLVALSAEYVHG